MDLHFGVKESEGLEAMGELAAVSSAWEAAAKLKERKDTLDAEARTEGRAVTIRKADFNQIRENFEGVFKPLRDDKCPSKVYFESKASELSEGCFSAERLSEMPSVTEGGTTGEAGPPVLTDQGLRYIPRQKATNAAPQSIEDIVERIEILGVCSMMVKMAHPSDPRMMTTEPGIFTGNCSYAEWIKGPEDVL